MGADLFESYVGSLVSALTLGAVAGAVSGVLYPLAIAGCGLIASIIATFFVKGDDNSNPQKASQEEAMYLQHLLSLCP